MRGLCVLLSAALALPLPSLTFAQEQPHALNLVIVEGDGAVNNIRQRTARDPIVQVQDENHKPVAGAAVVFLLPEHGAGGTFTTGGHSLTVTTDAQGRAVAHGLTPNNVKGQFQIQVTASYGGLTTTAAISQTNAVAVAAGGGAAAAAGISTKLIVILAVAAGAAAGGAYAATHIGGNSGTTPATTIAAGAGTVGPPK